jgi:hypothetical protein
MIEHLAVAAAYVVQAAARAQALVPASQKTLDALAIVHKGILRFPQISIATEHVLHGGMYARTIRLDPEVVMMGSLIKLATVLIVSGPCSVLIGDERVELDGYNVIPGCAGRKQLFVTRGQVEMTMIFPTQAKTVEEAENEVFAESDLLMSRKDGSGDTFTITGE